jgi:hypothetical protein
MIIIYVVIGFMHNAWEDQILETLEHLTAGEAKELDGKVHLYLCIFSYCYFPIIVCGFQS